MLEIKYLGKGKIIKWILIEIPLQVKNYSTRLRAYSHQAKVGAKVKKIKEQVKQIKE